MLPSLPWLGRSAGWCPSVQMVLPIGWDAPRRSGYRLVEGVMVRWCQGGALEEAVGAVIPEPILSWLEALDHRVARGSGVASGVLARRVVAASDVAALRAPSQVEPPATRLDALDAAGAARRSHLIDGRVSHRTVAPPSRWPRLARPAGMLSSSLIMVPPLCEGLAAGRHAGRCRRRAAPARPVSNQS